MNSLLQFFLIFCFHLFMQIYFSVYQFIYDLYLIRIIFIEIFMDICSVILDPSLFRILFPIISTQYQNQLYEQLLRYLYNQCLIFRNRFVDWLISEQLYETIIIEENEF